MGWRPTQVVTACVQNPTNVPLSEGQTAAKSACVQVNMHQPEQQTAAKPAQLGTRPMLHVLPCAACADASTCLRLSAWRLESTAFL